MTIKEARLKAEELEREVWTYSKKIKKKEKELSGRMYSNGSIFSTEDQQEPTQLFAVDMDHSQAKQIIRQLKAEQARKYQEYLDAERLVKRIIETEKMF